MSTTPERPQNVSTDWKSSLPDARKASAIIVKNTLGILALIAGIVALGMNFEIVWDILAEFVPLAFEIIEEALDTFFETVVRLNPAFAQMATAYFGFVTAIILLYFVVRRGMVWWARWSDAYTSWKDGYVGAWRDWTTVQTVTFLKWWNTLDMGNKFITIVIGTLLGIPILLLLSYALGSLVAVLL
jgi:hypothetical protein